MSALLRQAAVAAGMLDLDCLKLVPFSREDPHAQIAALRKSKPEWFHDAPIPDARTMTPQQAKDAFAELQRAEARRQSDAAHARTMERLHADRAAADALRDQRAMQMRERHAEEHRKLSERHAAQRSR